MNNNKATNILLGILIVVLVVIGFLIFKSNNYYSITDIVPQEKESISDQNISPKQDLNTQKESNWRSISKESLVKLIGDNPDLFYDGQLMLNFSQEIDLTGDGSLEGLFGFPYGNGDMYYLFISENGNIVNAKLKDLNEKISPVSFFSKGTVMYESSYKLLPGERGFYVYSKHYNEQTENQDCGTGGVIAYQWNPKTNLFEHNTALTAKYTAIECK